MIARLAARFFFRQANMYANIKPAAPPTCACGQPAPTMPSARAVPMPSSPAPSLPSPPAASMPIGSASNSAGRNSVQSLLGSQQKVIGGNKDGPPPV